MATPLGPLLSLVLVCASVTILHSHGYYCTRPCPWGEHCEFRRFYYGHYYFTRRQVCVEDRLPVERPPSCQDVRCGDLETCVLQQVTCVRDPCHPLPVCIENQCTRALCPTGTTCVTTVIPGSNPTCSDFPRCRYSFRCEALAKPKPGFCPPPEQVSQSNGNLCQYDNNCASNLLCCPGASRGGLNCTAPAFPDPCADKKCPPQAPTCALSGRSTTCLDFVCQPDSFICRDSKQTFCSDEAEIRETDVPAPSDC